MSEDKTLKPKPKPKPYLTTNAASETTGIPVSMIARALADGELAYLQPNGERGWRLIRPEDLDAWVESITKTAKKKESKS